jgi:2-polyprenyl-3-methyl-5-hydroxy-6-metoxy-1,4-benzoquinol methylase
MADESKRLMVYAHFDHENKIRGYTEYALKKAREVCRNIVFVSNASLSEEEQKKVTPYCNVVCVKDNRGFDFGMWKLGLSQVNLQDWDEIVLLNSSVYGPIFPLQEAFDAMSNDGCDFWGMTESYEQTRHLQSYFIVFRQKVIRSLRFAEFWNSILEYRDKNQVIRSYEVGLSQWLVDCEFTMGVYCSWPKLIRYYNAGHVRRLRHLFNPSVKLPTELIALKMPFVKREVFRDNPFGVNLNGLRTAVALTSYPPELILNERPSGGDPIQSDSQPVCPLCGTAGRLLYRGLKDRNTIGGLCSWNVRRCRNRSCGSAWQDPRPREGEIWKAYQNYYTCADGHAYLHWYYPPQYGRFKRLLIRMLNKSIKQFRLSAKRYSFYYHGLNDAPTGRLLEIGCGSGGRIAGLKQFGWEVEGQDVDLKAVERCREQGLKVHHGPIESCCLSKGSYDVILMAHVLEHLHNPADVLKQCREMLKPGGRIIITTPNMSALGRLVYRKYWLPLDPPRHITIFSPESLRNILKTAGFDSVKVSTVTYNMELISLHSRDIRYNNFTDLNSTPRLGKELMPVFLQFCALVLGKIFPWTGEECFARAETRPAS